MEISFTRLRIYLECPWKYKLQFIGGRRIPPTPNSCLGLSIHRALESFHRSSATTLEALLEFYESRWVAAAFLNPEEERRYAAKGRRILERFFKAQDAERTRIEGVEREFVYPLGRHTVCGMIDRIDRHADGRLEIIDYKSSMEPATEEEVGDNLQLRFYALGVRECMGAGPALLTIYYLASGRRVSVPYGSEREAELKRLIAGTADRIEAGGFKADTGFCPRCPFHASCAFSPLRGR